MPVDATTHPALAVEQPGHGPGRPTTYELTYYRRRLENAIAFLDKQDPVPPIRADLQAAMDGVTAEQDDRARIAAADA